MLSMTCSSKSSSTKTSTSKTGTQRLLLLLCPPATAMLYVVYLTDPHFTRVQDKSQDHCTYIMETTPLVSGQKKFHLRPCFRSCCFSAAGLGGASHRRHVIVLIKYYFHILFFIIHEKSIILCENSSKCC